MRTFAKVSFVVMLLVFAAAPMVLAEEGAVQSSTILTITQFGRLQENRGLDSKLVQRRYIEYRNGRFPVSTLDKASMR